MCFVVLLYKAALVWTLLDGLTSCWTRGFTEKVSDTADTGAAHVGLNPVLVDLRDVGGENLRVN